MTMPNVIGLGFERSGTTSIHYSLSRHPEVLVSSRKEPNFFVFDVDGTPPATMSPQQIERQSKRSGKTRADYESLFADAGTQHKAVVEFSPSYLRWPNDVAPRICAELPDVKLVAIVRHPVEHARSILAVWLGRQPFLTELIGALERNRPSPDGGPALLDHGRYADSLRPFYEWFPRKQIKVLQFDRLETDLLLDLQEFIGVTPMPSLPVERLNSSGEAKSGILRRAFGVSKRLARAVLPERAVRPLLPLAHRFQAANTRQAMTPIPPDLRATLTEEFYREEIDKLERLTRLDLSAWRNGHKEETRRAVA